MLGRDGGYGELRGEGSLLHWVRLYLKAMVMMALMVLVELVELAIKLAVGFVFYALLIYSLFPRLGYELNDRTLEIVFLTSLVFVLCQVSLTLGDMLIDFLFLYRGDMQ